MKQYPMKKEELEKLKKEELEKLLKDLVKEGENEFIEFKENKWNQQKDLCCDIGKYISALSNGACLSNKEFGYLIFGIDDNGKILGTSFKLKKLKAEGNCDLELWLKTRKINPNIHFEFIDFEINGLPKGNSICLIKVAAAKTQPTEFERIAYGRIGQNKTKIDRLSADEIRKIYNSGVDWSAKIIEEASINDLDEEAILKAREKFKERRENARYSPEEVNSWDSLTFLNKADITKNGKITNASLILLGKRESRNLLQNSGVAEITWELKTREESAYERFYPPFLLNTSKVWERIRNTKYKLFPTHELLAREVNKYDEKVVLEALYNCIAHQDYFSNNRGIIVTEEVDHLRFTSFGNFFEGKAEDYAVGKRDKAQDYRNSFLVSGMNNLGMIDKMGYGIKSMFAAQRKKYFPMPDYSKSDSQKVVLEIYGRVIDEKFSQILMEKDLDFQTTILLDRVQKNLIISDEDAKILRKKKLIEGRKPNYFIAAVIASATNQEERYLKNRGADNHQLKDWILLHLNKFDQASKSKIDSILTKFLPEALSEKQKKKKVTNLLHEMSKKDKSIKNIGTKRTPKWIKLDKL